MNKNTAITRFSAVLLSLCMLFSTIGMSVSYAADASDSGIVLSAGIYKDADRKNLITQLTDTGATLSDWEYLSDSASSANRYLGISLSGFSMSEDVQYRLVIEMAPILYINQNSAPTLANTTVSYTANSPVTVNTDGKYTPKEFSLSNLTYLIDSGTESLTLGLPLRFDINLWNKQAGGQLGDGTDPLLRVYLQKKQGDDFATVENHDVKLLQATVSGSVQYSVSHSMFIEGGSTTSTNIMGADDSLRMIFSHFGSTQNSIGHYIGEVEVKITLPTCTVNGTKYTLGYKNFAFRTSGGTSSFQESDDAATGVLTFSAENFYFNTYNLFEIFFTAPEELPPTSAICEFQGSVSVVADGITMASGKSITINLDTGTEARLKVVNAATGKANVIDLDTVQPFGNIAIRNDAAFKNASEPLLIKLTFDSNNTNTVAVTSVNLMCDRASKTIDISYTLVDKEGNPAYSGAVFTTSIANKYYTTDATAVCDNIYITFTRNDLPVEEHKKYYFKTLSYTMEKLPGNTKAYHTGAALASYSAGTIWGYVTTATVPPVMPEHTMEVFASNNTAEALLTGSTKTNIDAGTTVSYGIESATASAKTVTAGDPVTIGGKVFVAGFPYSSNNCLNDIRLGFILPEGVTVNTASVTAKYTGGSLSVSEYTVTKVNDTENIHIIQLQQGKKIGYYNEKLSALENGSTMTFSVQLNTEKKMSTQTISLRECVFVAGLGRINGSGGSYADHAVTDIHDLNANGKYSDNVGSFGKETTQSITFQAPPAQLDITDYLTNSEDASGDSLTMESFADIINYNLRINCNEGGSATGFYYIIPIGKTTIDSDTNFVEKCQVDLKLSGQAEVNTVSGTAMKVLYSTAAVTGYASALALDDASWSETLPDGKTWESVTAIKVIATAETIVNGSVNIISVPLGYAGEDTRYEQLAGMQIKWSSRGYYRYQLGANSNAGTESTDGCTVTLTYTPQEPIKFSLTAAKGGVPQGNGANTYTFELPQFLLAQKYSVKEITPYNVNLMNGDYDFTTATSAEANQNFRINISVKNKVDDASGSTPVAIAKDDTIVGSLPKETIPVFTFTIDNADALSDIVTERYVTLTLIGDNGVIVPVVITILRELATAEPTSSAIVAGKLYSPFNDNTTLIDVSRDSAFTAQFVSGSNYIPANYTDRAIVFGTAPADGTTVTMIDWTDPVSPAFYHYTLNGETSSVDLTDFVGMGNSEIHPEFNGTDVVTERLLFIVSFPPNGEAIRTNNTISLTKRLRNDTKDPETTALNFSTVEKRSFTLTPSAQSASIGREFTLKYTSHCAVTDSRYTGRTLSLVIAASDGYVFPTDSRVEISGTSYYLTSRGTFIVPLTDVQKGDGSVSISFHSNSPFDTISIKAELWASATANGGAPMMGDKAAGHVTVTISNAVAPSFVVLSMSERLLYVDDLTSEISVKFDSKNTDIITLELQKKTDAAYVTQTTALESVNGVTAADAGQGVFNVKGGSPVTVKLSKNTQTGTYRLLFKASNSAETIEVPYNFVVLDR